MKQEIESLQAQLEEITNKNREEEAQLRKKKYKIESEVENWIHKYDQDMDEKQAELEDITVCVTKCIYAVCSYKLKFLLTRNRRYFWKKRRNWMSYRPDIMICKRNMNESWKKNALLKKRKKSKRGDRDE